MTRNDGGKLTRNGYSREHPIFKDPDASVVNQRRMAGKRLQRQGVGGYLKEALTCPHSDAVVVEVVRGDAADDDGEKGHDFQVAAKDVAQRDAAMVAQLQQALGDLDGGADPIGGGCVWLIMQGAGRQQADAREGRVSDGWGRNRRRH